MTARGRLGYGFPSNRRESGESKPRLAYQFEQSYRTMDGVEKTQRFGRWPSNLTLQHKKECKFVELVKVDSYGPKTNPAGVVTGVNAMRIRPPTEAGMADDGAYETVEKWDCVDGCPIKAMDVDGPASYSRSFNVFHWTEEEMEEPIWVYCAKPNEWERNAGCENVQIPEGFWKTIKDGPADWKKYDADVEAGVAYNEADAKAQRRQEHFNGHNGHATCKPVLLVRHFSRLVCPNGGTVLDPFLGSGTHAIGALLEGQNCIGLELVPYYMDLAKARLEWWKLRAKPPLPTMDLRLGDNTTILPTLPSNSVDAMVTDPPGGFSIGGNAWDSDKGGRDKWIAWLQGVMTECKRVLKPGAYALVWSYTRSSHWTAMALENAGFDIRATAAHVYPTGYAHTAGEIRPAVEHWIVAQKPCEGTVEENVRKYGVGRMRVDECRTKVLQWKEHPVQGDLGGGF